jgi:hypothetical protein
MVSESAPHPPEGGVEFTLTVWPNDAVRGWHACVVAPDASRREFASPFELARYLARPAAAARESQGKGLR